jgi:hypothetical protein
MGIFNFIFRLFGFGKKQETKKEKEYADDEILKKLHEIHLAIDRSPKNINKLETLFLREQAKAKRAIKGKKVRNKDHLVAQIQAVQKQIKRVREDIKRGAAAERFKKVLEKRKVA